MDSVKCEAFVTAVEQGSLTNAANILGYTQPGITRMIKALEEELGFPLLTRSKNGVVPTANGEKMLPLMKEVVRASRQVEEVGSEIQGVVTGVLTIGSYYSISSRILPSVLMEFTTKYPGVHVQVKEGGNADMAQWIEDRSVDFCFAARPDTECEWYPLFKDEHVLWLPKDHPLAKRKSVPVRLLDNESFIITMPDKDTDIDRLLRDYNVKPDIRFSTKDAYTTYCMVDAGLGISMNQRLIFENWKGTVVAKSFSPKQYIELGISISSMKDASPASLRFIEMIKKGLRPQL